MTTQKTTEYEGQLENVHPLAMDDGSADTRQLIGPVYTPRVFPLSGLYNWSPAVKWEAVYEQLRLDVDGNYPQMVASGTITRRSVASLAVHWIANLTAGVRGSWSGPIWFKDTLGGPGSYPFPYTQVAIVVSGSTMYSRTPPSAAVTFSGGGSADRVRVLTLISPWFHEAEFEFDRAEGVAAVIAVPAQGHPNRPATLPSGNISIETVYSRAGFEVKKSGRDNAVPLTGARTDALWSDSEMHDAMQTYWSRFANTAQWSMWTFFASLHEEGSALGGTMFDDIGPNHRQGASIFENSFISQAPAGDLAPSAWVQRMRFFAAVHEMGHAFNLAHSWDKSVSFQGAGPWIPQADELEARSFMNYPQLVDGGQTAFFANFEYRFSDAELLFLRHAPERFVQMGDAEWFDHHGFRQANVSREPKFKLELRVNRPKALFEFMEPVVLELKLTNTSGEPQLIHEKVLADLSEMTIVVKKRDRTARQFMPHVRYCFSPANRVLMPGESTYASLFISAGRGGWYVDEPGYYTVQMALHLDGEDLVSSELKLRVAPPCGCDEELLAQELFTDDVGRILAFDGSRFFEAGNDTLREITEKLSGRRIALHARIALAIPLMREYKSLALPDDAQGRLCSAAELGGKFKVSRPQLDEASKELTLALVEQAEVAATTLGHIDTKHYVDRFTECLAADGRRQEAAGAQGVLHQTLASRKVLPEVLESIQARRDSYGATKRRT